ncbi:MAG: hypothetical protein JNK38_01100 [Acidobacteria bacterium]|nr:hypothetical protein [Acidobacteriota bacterium]
MEVGPHDWLIKTATGAVLGAILMRLYDALKMVSREDLSKALEDFSKNQIAPMKERQSKFDLTLQDMQRAITQTKEIVVRIATKLEVSHE